MAPDIESHIEPKLLPSPRTPRFLDWRDRQFTRAQIVSKLKDATRNLTVDDAIPATVNTNGSNQTWITRPGEDNVYRRMWAHLYQPDDDKYTHEDSEHTYCMHGHRIRQLGITWDLAASLNYEYGDMDLSKNIGSSGLYGNEVEEATKDLGLTIGIHPAQFGVRAECKAELWVPGKVMIECHFVEDMCKFLSEEHLRSTMCLDGGKLHSALPEYNASLKVKVDGVKVRAVLVTGRNSLRTLLPQAKETPFLDNIICMMVDDEPSVGDREFLSLLSKDLVLEDVPFIYLSDATPQAIMTFITLKYGSREHAYASKSMTCQQLKWRGITLDQFNDVALSYPFYFHHNVVLKRPGTSEQAFTKLFSEEASIYMDKVIDGVFANKERIRELPKADDPILAYLEDNDFLALEPALSGLIQGWRDGTGRVILMQYVEDIETNDPMPCAIWPLLRDIVAECNNDLGAMESMGYRPLLEARSRRAL